MENKILKMNVLDQLVFPDLETVHLQPNETQPHSAGYAIEEAGREMESHSYYLTAWTGLRMRK